MCGIAGQVASPGGTVERETVERMRDRLVHRGPDSSGLHLEPGVALGVRRLAIIDVAAGDQPIYNEDRSVAVVSNGEIYNFAELRERLRARGHRFATGADTEVIAHLYEERGPRLVEDLRGMFAFALWDAANRRLVLARDRVGKKPLLYWERDGALSFASELAALLEDRRIPRRMDVQAIDAYLAFLYVPHPLSAIEGVRKLPPASTLVWEDGTSRLERYWHLDFARKEAGSEEELGERIRSHLREAVRLRLVSERPLGAFLSGGVDSAAVVATMAELSPQPVKTFSIGFDSDRFNELPHARRVAKLFGTDHTEHVVTADAVSILPKLITHYGDPFGDSSAIPSYYVARAAREDVVVALNGDGGDESFAGYNRYVSNTLAERLEAVPLFARRGLAAVAGRFPEPESPSSNPARIRRLALSLPLPAAERYAMRMTYCSEELRDELYAAGLRAGLNGRFAHRVIAEPWRASAAASPVDRMLDVDV
nr:asparagine synthase (glutamine-hydrolyzing) [Actinomycetota bacterium]